MNNRLELDSPTQSISNQYQNSSSTRLSKTSRSTHLISGIGQQDYMNRSNHAAKQQQQSQQQQGNSNNNGENSQNAIHSYHQNSQEHDRLSENSENQAVSYSQYSQYRTSIQNPGSTTNTSGTTTSNKSESLQQSLVSVGRNPSNQSHSNINNTSSQAQGSQANQANSNLNKPGTNFNNNSSSLIANLTRISNNLGGSNSNANGDRNNIQSGSQSSYLSTALTGSSYQNNNINSSQNPNFFLTNLNQIICRDNSNNQMIELMQNTNDIKQQISQLQRHAKSNIVQMEEGKMIRSSNSNEDFKSPRVRDSFQKVLNSHVNNMTPAATTTSTANAFLMLSQHKHGNQGAEDSSMRVSLENQKFSQGVFNSTNQLGSAHPFNYNSTNNSGLNNKNEMSSNSNHLYINSARGATGPTSVLNLLMESQQSNYNSVNLRDQKNNMASNISGENISNNNNNNNNNRGSNNNLFNYTSPSAERASFTNIWPNTNKNILIETQNTNSGNIISMIGSNSLSTKATGNRLMQFQQLEAQNSVSNSTYGNHNSNNTSSMNNISQSTHNQNSLNSQQISHSQFSPNQSTNALIQNIPNGQANLLPTSNNSYNSNTNYVSSCTQMSSNIASSSYQNQSASIERKSLVANPILNSSNLGNKGGNQGQLGPYSGQNVNKILSEFFTIKSPRLENFKNEEYFQPLIDRQDDRQKFQAILSNSNLTASNQMKKIERSPQVPFYFKESVGNANNSSGNSNRVVMGDSGKPNQSSSVNRSENNNSAFSKDPQKYQSTQNSSVNGSHIKYTYSSGLNVPVYQNKAQNNKQNQQKVEGFQNLSTQMFNNPTLNNNIQQQNQPNNHMSNPSSNNHNNTNSLLSINTVNQAGQRINPHQPEFYRSQTTKNSAFTKINYSPYNKNYLNLNADRSDSTSTLGHAGMATSANSQISFYPNTTKNLSVDNFAKRKQFFEPSPRVNKKNMNLRLHETTNNLLVNVNENGDHYPGIDPDPHAISNQNSTMTNQLHQSAKNSTSQFFDFNSINIADIIEDRDAISNDRVSSNQHINFENNNRNFVIQKLDFDEDTNLQQYSSQIQDDPLQQPPFDPQILEKGEDSGRRVSAKYYNSQEDCQTSNDGFPQGQKEPNSDLRALMERTNTILNNYKSQENQWKEEKQTMGNEIESYKNQLNIYQQEIIRLHSIIEGKNNLSQKLK